MGVSQCGTWGDTLDFYEWYVELAAPGASPPPIRNGQSLAAEHDGPLAAKDRPVRALISWCVAQLGSTVAETAFVELLLSATRGRSRYGMEWYGQTPLGVPGVGLWCWCWASCRIAFRKIITALTLPRLFAVSLSPVKFRDKGRKEREQRE